MIQQIFAMWYQSFVTVFS